MSLQRPKSVFAPYETDPVTKFTKRTFDLPLLLTAFQVRVYLAEHQSLATRLLTWTEHTEPEVIDEYMAQEELKLRRKKADHNSSRRNRSGKG